MKIYKQNNNSNEYILNNSENSKVSIFSENNKDEISILQGLNKIHFIFNNKYVYMYLVIQRKKKNIFLSQR